MKYLVLIFGFFCTVAGFAQKHPIGLDFGLNYFTYTSPEFKLSALYDIKLNKGDRGMSNKYLLILAGTGSELQFHPVFIIAPKLSVRGLLEMFNSYSGISFGGNYLAYTDFSKTQHALQPQVGIHLFFGTVELLYGYNYFIGNRYSFPVNRHTISLSFKPYIIISALQGLGEHE